MTRDTEADEGLIVNLFKTWGDNYALAFSSVAAFIGTLATGVDILNFSPSGLLELFTLFSILVFLAGLHYIVIKKSLRSIGKSVFQIPFQIYQPEIKYLIALYNGDLEDYNIENEDVIKKSLNKAGFIDDSGLTEKGVTKAIDSKQSIRGRFVNYTAISVTALILFYSILRLLQNSIISESRSLFSVAAILILWVAAVLMMTNLITRRELLIQNKETDSPQ